MLSPLLSEIIKSDCYNYLQERVNDIRVSYYKKWVPCSEIEITKTDLRKSEGLSTATLTKLSKNQEAFLGVLMKIVDVLECNIGNMLDFIPTPDENKGAC